MAERVGLPKLYEMDLCLSEHHSFNFVAARVMLVSHKTHERDEDCVCNSLDMFAIKQVI